MLVDIPYVAFLQMLILAPMYFLARLDTSAGVFFHSYLVFFLSGLAGSYMGGFFVAFLPNEQVVRWE
jgi:hypothetical protein